jgi:uncharacterized membrane protein YeaQ/YmgE (transglycosylase-associated protein family)
MAMSAHSLIVILIVGLVAGWLAGKIVRGGGFGLIGDIIVGVIGAFIGRWLFGVLEISIGINFWNRRHSHRDHRSGDPPAASASGATLKPR